LLGIAEIGRIAVDTLDVIGEDAREPFDYDEAGQFRWPKAILMTRAWRFAPQPKLLDVLAEQLPYHATPQAILLSAEDADAVQGLPLEEVAIPSSAVLEKARLLDRALHASRPTTGPTPSSWTGATGRDVNRTAFTYSLRFGSLNIWKIGYAIDVKERLKQVNWHIPPEAVPERWGIKFQQQWSSEPDAYAMEQRVLKVLSNHRTEGERVSCTESD
jgi:T5orf172 domain-containing protein